MTTFGLVKFSFLVYVLVSSGIIGISYALTKKIGFISKVLAAGMVLGLLFFLNIFVIEPNWIDTTTVKIKDRELAEVIGKTKIVHITDLHMNEGINYRLSRMVQKVNALKPDLIFITGDFIDDLTQVEPAIKLLKKLKAKIGIYAVPGNTDHIVMDANSLRRELSPSGIDILINESRAIKLDNNRILWVVGVDDPKYRHAKMNASFREVPRDTPVILLAHNPKIFKQAVERDVNLVLTGDTHGGQVGIPLLIKMSNYANRTPYMRGFFKQENTVMYVNRGIGMKTLPIRFLCRPEIAKIKVKK